MIKWVELAREPRGHLQPTALYAIACRNAVRAMDVHSGTIGAWYRNHEFTYLCTEGVFENAAKRILERLRTERSFLRSIVENNRTKIAPMLRLAERLATDDLLRLTDTELYQRWAAWLASFLEMMTLSVMGTTLEFETPVLTNELIRRLEQHLGTGNSEIGTIFQTLTTAATPTLAAKEELALLTLRLQHLSGAVPEQLIVQHTKCWSWVAFGYDGPGWADQDIRQRLEALPSETTAMRQLMEEKRSAPAQLRAEQRVLIDRLGLSAEDKRLFAALRTLGFWKFERKFYNQRAHQLADSFFKEIARRFSLSLPQAKMIPPSEMEAVLVYGHVNAQQLTDRIKESAFLTYDDHVEVPTSRDNPALFAELSAAFEPPTDLRELRGNVAYPGSARGIVRRVELPEQMGKLTDGEILMASSTSPAIVPAMKRAGAILTDAGGITSHAAIVARELKVPTVIGLKFATKILRDGDLVVVDATSGIVRKLEEPPKKLALSKPTGRSGDARSGVVRKI